MTPLALKHAPPAFMLWLGGLVAFAAIVIVLLSLREGRRAARDGAAFLSGVGWRTGGRDWMSSEGIRYRGEKDGRDLIYRYCLQDKYRPARVVLEWKTSLVGTLGVFPHAVIFGPWHEREMTFGKRYSYDTQGLAAAESGDGHLADSVCVPAVLDAIQPRIGNSLESVRIKKGIARVTKVVFRLPDPGRSIQFALRPTKEAIAAALGDCLTIREALARVGV